MPGKRRVRRRSPKRARENLPDEPAPARPSFPRIRELSGRARVDVMLSDFDGVFRGDARTARTMSCTMDEFLDLADYPGGNRVYLAQAPVPEEVPQSDESNPTTSSRIFVKTSTACRCVSTSTRMPPMNIMMRRSTPPTWGCPRFVFQSTLRRLRQPALRGRRTQDRGRDDFDTSADGHAVIRGHGWIQSQPTRRRSIHRPFLEQLARTRAPSYGDNVPRNDSARLSSTVATSEWRGVLFGEKLGIGCKLESLGAGDALYLPQVVGTSSSPSLERWL